MLSVITVLELEDYGSTTRRLWFYLLVKKYFLMYLVLNFPLAASIGELFSDCSVLFFALVTLVTIYVETLFILPSEGCLYL